MVSKFRTKVRNQRFVLEKTRREEITGKVYVFKNLYVF